MDILDDDLEAELERAEIAATRLRMDRSFEQDAERARISYTEHTATALRRRVLSQLNGHAATA